MHTWGAVRESVLLFKANGVSGLKSLKVKGQVFLWMISCSIIYRAKRSHSDAQTSEQDDGQKSKLITFTGIHGINIGRSCL